MPKERKVRTHTHDISVRLGKRQFVLDGDADHVDIGNMEGISGNVILSELATEGRPTMKKKEKQQQKHEAFLHRLESSRTPYSRSHAKRLKRKARDEVGSGLKEMELALPDLAVEDERLSLPDASGPVNNAGASKTRSSRPRMGLIGEGKGEPLRKSQRQRILKTEKFRQPLLTSMPEFKDNPFQAIRTHAQNTLVKHKPVT